MHERDDNGTTPAQKIAELNALREVAESTRDRLRILIVSAKQNERLLGKTMARDGKSTRDVSK